MAKNRQSKSPLARVTNRDTNTRRFRQMGQEVGFYPDPERKPVFVAANTKEARCLRALAKAMTREGVTFRYSDLSTLGATCIILEAS